MPRMNGVSYWYLMVAIVLLLGCQVSWDRPVCCGWTLYAPLSTRDGDSSVISTDVSLV